MSNPLHYPVFRLKEETTRKKWCVYAHSPVIEPNGTEVRYIGFCPLTEIMTPPDCRRNNMWFTHVLPFEYETRVIFIGDKVECMLKASHLRAQHRPICNAHGHVSTRGQRVRCLTNGQEFDNATEAATFFGVSKSALSNHLNGRPEFPTVRGMIFERIM